MACGCPVAVSRIPPLEEVCGDAAVYFDPTDVDDIAAGIIGAIDGAPAGVARARSYTWTTSAHAHEAAFRLLLG
jgi:glycosyltransferase involved in cell wall biosynthesis